MATPNLGLTIPVGGTTPNAANNTTAGTYPYIIAANLNLIDSLCYSLNNPVPTAGIDINANLTFSGYSLTSVGGLTSTGTLTTSGTVSGATLQFDTANTYTSAGTMTLAPNVASGGTALIVNNTVSMSSGSIFAVQNDGTTVLQVDSAGDIDLSGNIYQTTNLTGQLIQGNVESGGTGVTLNTGTHTLTSGYIVAFENNGTVKAKIDYNGNITGTIISGTNLNATGMTVSADGHLIPTASAPTGNTASGSTSTYWGLADPTALTVTGFDAGFIISLTTPGTGQTQIPAGTQLFSITLGTAYSSANFAAVCVAHSGPGLAHAVSYACVPAGGSAFSVYNGATAFTPAAGTTYTWSIITVGAGATS